MKPSKFVLVFYFFLPVFLVWGCSKDNEALLQEEYLSTLVDGEDFSVRKTNGVITCEKQLTN